MSAGAELAMVMKMKMEGEQTLRTVKGQIDGMRVSIRGVGADASHIEALRSHVEHLKASSRGLPGAFNAAKSALSDMAAAGSKIALGVGIGAGALAVGAVASLAGPIRDASDLAESQSKVGVVFGDSATAINEFAAGAAQNLGQSKQAALEMAGTFGNLFTSMGLGQGPAANLSKEILTLGSDLASFNNIDPGDALEKLRAGLIGEAEPLRALGVNLNEAAMQQKAFAMGFGKSAADLTDAEKIQARYALILEQTKNAQGDFARTSTGLANAQRIISASFKDASGAIGEEFLPMIAPLTSAFAQALPGAIAEARTALQSIGPAIRDQFGAAIEWAKNDVLPGLSQAMAWVQEHGETLKGALIGVGGVLAGAAVVGAVAALGAALAAIVSPIGLVVAGAALLGAAWSENWGGIRDVVTDVWDNNLQPALASLGAWLSETLPIAMAALKSAWDNVLSPALGALGNVLGGVVLPVLGAVVNVGLALVQAAFNDLSNTWNTVLSPALTALWTAIDTNVMPSVRAFADFLKDNILVHFRDVAQFIRDAVTALNDFANAVRGTPSAPGAPGGGLPEGYTPPQSLPEYALGTSYVPRTGYALLHRGEAVIPAERNNRGTTSGVVNHYNISIDARGSNANEVQRGVTTALDMARARGG